MPFSENPIILLVDYLKFMNMKENVHQALGIFIDNID
jgi:hypothetical protein